LADNDLPNDTVWGAAAIGAVLGLNRRQAFYILEEDEKARRNGVTRGLIPAKKIHGRWVASRAALRAYLSADSTPALDAPPTTEAPESSNLRCRPTNHGDWSRWWSEFARRRKPPRKLPSTRGP
jgi:hypothetical protein